MSLRAPRFPAILATLALALTLAGCQKAEQAAVAAPTTPTAAIDAAVAGLKAGDLKALLESQLPPAHVEKLRTEWKEGSTAEVSEEERQEFAETVGRLIEPGAEEKLMAELEPQLVKFETEIAPQMPMMIAMGRGLAMSGIEEDKTLTPEQKQQAIAGLDALAKWVQETNFSDRTLARQAVAQLAASAREMNLKSIDEVRALSFDEALARGSIALRGLKQVLATYGMSVDEMLGTVKTELVSETGDAAKVKVSYTMFGQPLSMVADMVKVDGRWYGKTAIDELNKADEPEIAEGEAEGEIEAEPAAKTTES